MLEGLPLKYKEYILANLSTTLPLPTTASLITDEGYWRRRAQANFKLCNPENHGDSWKQLFFELHVQALLEARYPKRVESAEETATLEQALQLAAPYVRRVHLRQLRPAYDAATTTPSGAEGALELKDVLVCPTDLNPDHLDPGLLFRNLKNLTELVLFYGCVCACVCVCVCVLVLHGCVCVCVCVCVCGGCGVCVLVVCEARAFPAPLLEWRY